MNLDEKYMRLALELAKRGKGKTSPNPMVGALVVRGKTILGRGYHRQAGESHAEILALREAGNSARGATLYLNLEPCDHYGKTPPCSRAILRAGIRRVVAGMKDPNPLVAGRGFGRLRKAGIRVDVGVLEKECQELNAPFRKFITTGKPFVFLKMAASLDGKVATRTGHSRWISSEISRNYVHRLRQNVDAVMVGIGTVLKDNPLLTVRVPEIKRPHRPLRIVVDSRLRIPLDCRLVRTAGEYPTLVATTPAASSSKIKRLIRAKVQVWVIANDASGRVRLKTLMARLGRRDTVSVLLEGGPTLNFSALRERLVDRLLIFLAAKVIGGQRAPSMIGGEGVTRIQNARPVRILNVRRLGPDLLIEGSMAKAE